ncbi:MAG: flagellar biosynthetic protein FliO [Bacteroidota bacterium]
MRFRLRPGLATPRPLRRALLFAGGLLLLFLVVHLAPASETARAGPRLLSAGNLLALALLAGGGAWALHLRKRAASAGHAPALLEPVGQMQLAAGQQLRLVRCGGEVLLLGVASGQITLLRRYDAEAFDIEAFGAERAPDLAEDAPMPPGFAELLRTSLGRPTHA